MAYTITFEEEPNKLVYLAGNPVEYLVKVAYGGGDDLPVTMVATFTVVQGGVSYTQSLTKTVKYYGTNEAYFYFDFSGCLKRYVYPKLQYSNIADTDALHLNVMDCYFSSIGFQLYVEDANGLIISQGSPVNPATTTVGVTRGLFQDDNETRDILDYLFVGNSGTTSKSLLSFRPNGAKIGVSEWEVMALLCVGDIQASSQPLNGVRVTSTMPDGTTSIATGLLTFPNNTVIKDDLYYIVPVGTANLTGLISAGAVSYTVEFGYKTAVGPGFTRKFATINRTIVSCTPETKVIFFNSLGGIDCVNFYYSRSDVYESESESFTKQKPDFFYNSVNISERGAKKIRAFSLNSTELQTECSKAEYEYLAKELLNSTEVYIITQDFGIETKLIPVIVTSSEIEGYNSETAELFTTFKFQYANSQKGL